MADEHDKLIDDVGAELGELRRAADRLDEAVAAQFGLNRTDLRCLGILYRRGRVTAGELAEESGLTPGAITTVLDRMERGGYANRVADPTDRRRVLVTSTAATRELGARMYGEVELAGRAQLEPLAPDHVAVIRDYLRGIREFYETLVDGLGGTSPGAASDAATAQEGSFTAPLGGVACRTARVHQGRRQGAHRGRCHAHRAVPRRVRGRRPRHQRRRRDGVDQLTSGAFGRSTGAPPSRTSGSTRPCPGRSRSRAGCGSSRPTFAISSCAPSR